MLRTKSQQQLELLSRRSSRKNPNKPETRTEHPGDLSESNWTSASPSSSPEASDGEADKPAYSVALQRTDTAGTVRAQTGAKDEGDAAHTEAPSADQDQNAMQKKAYEASNDADHESASWSPQMLRSRTHPEPRTSDAGVVSPTTPAPGPSPRSARSVRSSHSMLLGRQGFRPTAPVAPVLDTRRVTSTQQGTETEERPSQGPARFYLGEHEEVRAPISQPHMRSLGSSSNLTLEGMSHEYADSPQFTRGRVDSVSSLTSLKDRAPGLMRSSSTQSLHEGRLQRSTSSREQLSQLLQQTQMMRRGSVLPSITGEHSTPVRVGAGGSGSRLVTSTFANLLQAGRSTERPTKPIVSKFARYQQQFDPSASAQSMSTVASGADDVPGRVVSVDVPPTSVFSDGFVDRIKARMADDLAPTPPGEAPEPPKQYRYLLDYGLSGPSIDKDSLSHVELTPRPDSGLPLETQGPETLRMRGGVRVASNRPERPSAERAKLVVPDSATTLGPNMIPFHFIHALTSAMENALALDHAEVPAMASLLPGVADQDEAMLSSSPPTSSDADGSSEEEEQVHFIDNQSMRAIAYTAQAVSIQRIHTVTRRFADPFQEALSRVARASGYMSYLEAQEHAGRTAAPAHHAPAGGGGARLSSTGSVWHLGAMRGPSQAAETGQERPALTRSNTALAALGTLANRSGSPRHAPARG